MVSFVVVPADYVPDAHADEHGSNDHEGVLLLEQLGTTAANWKDKVCRMEDATATVQDRLTGALEWLFPVLVAYQQDSSRLYQDLQQLGLALLLVAWGCWVLRPRRRGNTHNSKNTSNNWNQSCNWLSSGARESDSQQLSTSPSPSQSTASPQPQQDDDDTDEERYEKFYVSLDDANPLKRLILPPSCRLVEKPRKDTAKTQRQQEKNKKTSMKKADSSLLSEDENPARRLANYGRQLLHFLRSIFWFDYVGAGWTLLCWLQGIHLRHRKKNGNNSSNTNDEADEETENHTERDESENGDSSDLDNIQSPRSPHDHPAIVATEANTDKRKGKSGAAQSSTNNKKKPAKKMDSSEIADARERLTQQEDTFRSPETRAARPRSGSESSTDMDHTSQSTTDSGPGFVMSLVRSRRNSKAAAAAPVTGSRHQKKDSLDAWRKSSRKAGSPLPGDLATAHASAKGSKTDGSPTINSQADDAMLTPSSSQALHERAIADDEEGSGRFYFDSEHSDMALKKLSIDIPVPDRNGYILGDHFLSDLKNSTPLLVFVNSRSGAQQGQLIIAQLQRLLNPIQIWDLAHGGPETVLESFLALGRLRILVCGGDGTVSWIIGSMEKMKLKRKWPPIAILPLGTGNDLARVHGWGGGYNNESLLSILDQISESYISLLDRWNVNIESQSKKEESKCFMNYLGVGADAQAALQVHYLRESRPAWFFSRIVNKIWYGIFGAEDIIMASSVNVRKEIKLVADGVPIPLPQDSQGIIVLNIDSYAGGVPMWSHGAKDTSKNWRPSAPRRSKSLNAIAFNRRQTSYMDRTDSADDLQMLTMTDDERYERVTACDQPSSCQDGMLEIVSIRGAFHLGQIRVGLGNAQRLCQCREATITVKNKVAVQIDGEPWKQRPCTIKISRKPEHAVMLHRSVDDGGIETEMSKLLEWAEERQLIDRDVHAVLMKEFSRRIEHLTRQRRVREQDNIMHTLKKAISQNALASNINGASPWNNGGLAF